MSCLQREGQLNTNLTLSEELFQELNRTLRSYEDVKYNRSSLGLCTFEVGLIDIICVDIEVVDKAPDRFLVLFDIDSLVRVLDEPFSTLKEMQDILDIIASNIKTIKNIIGDTKRSYLASMKSRMERWTPLHTQSLQEFLELADPDYWKFITDTY